MTVMDIGRQEEVKKKCLGKIRKTRNPTIAGYVYGSLPKQTRKTLDNPHSLQSHIGAGKSVLSLVGFRFA